MIEFSNLKALAEPFAELQLELSNPKKSTAAYNYKYAQLDQILEIIKKPLAEKGFSVIQAPFSSDGEIGVETMLLHKTGEYIKAAFSTKTNLTDPQKIGSIITYYRRYSILAIFNLAPEDDDAASASQSAQAKQNKNNNYNKNNNSNNSNHANLNAKKDELKKLLDRAGLLSPKAIESIKTMSLGLLNEKITEYRKKEGN